MISGQARKFEQPQARRPQISEPTRQRGQPSGGSIGRPTVSGAAGAGETAEAAETAAAEAAEAAAAEEAGTAAAEAALAAAGKGNG